MAISIEDVKRLKDLTGVGLTDAKKALDESNGDFDKALQEMLKPTDMKALEKTLERQVTDQ